VEVVGSSEETLVTFYQTTKCHIPEGRIFGMEWNGTGREGKDLITEWRKT
jgi:hypothetical protein